MTFQIESWFEIVAYCGVFLGALFAFDGFRQMLSRSESSADARNRRMRMIAKGASTEDWLRLLKPTQSGGLFAMLPFLGGFPKALRKAGLTILPMAFLAGCLLAWVLLAGVGSFVMPPLVALVSGCVLAVFVPFLIVHIRQKKRTERLIKQLPDALDLMGRGLRVGHPLNATIASVASDMADPVATEFGIMVDQIAYGDTLVDAFTDFADRTDTEDARYLSVAIAIQHGTGGDLAQILSTLAQVIRDRMAMRRKIVAISAEGRLTSIFLSCLPFFILLSTSISAPGYYSGVMDDPLFRPFALIVATLVVVNFLVMRKLVNFRF